MKILFIGDTHGNFEHLNNFLGILDESENQFDIIIQLGDFGYWPYNERCDLEQIDTKGRKLYFVDGNHEHHELLSEESKKDTDGSVIISDTVRYLPRGFVLNLEGVKFLSVGGAFSIDRPYRTEGISWFKEEQPTNAQMRGILNNPQDVDVILTHTIPSEGLTHTGYNINPEWKDYTCDFLSEVINLYKPRFGYAGHWHKHIEFETNGCKYKVLTNIESGYPYRFDGFYDFVDINSFKE